ncbi:uncharacterized protein LOC113338045 isoform X1 [Papaver somniferum]|uniref:uncharacterized protein LOC113338045 isoform X1 n=1 Tax=Papaver somniferum TaxID=3469 RepID=UPI000E6FD732|nr:uncharacterized protein LOC113338045 isoform X1 [Papaver somniferum]
MLFSISCNEYVVGICRNGFLLPLLCEGYSRIMKTQMERQKLKNQRRIVSCQICVSYAWNRSTMLFLFRVVICAAVQHAISHNQLPTRLGIKQVVRTFRH